MPITINGSGTITGLSVGGLPDGTVDRDTLAATAKGRVLQFKREYDTDQQNLGAGTHADLFPVTITPTDATTQILVTLTLAMGQMDCDGGVGVNYKYGSGSNTQLQTVTAGSGADAGFYSMNEWGVCDGNSMTPFTMEFIHDHDQTDTITYSLILNSVSECHINRAQSLNKASGTSVWTLLEMAT